KSVFKKRRNSASVVPVGGVCCTRLPTLLPLLPWAVRGAKVWLDLAFIGNVRKSVFKKRRNSASVVPVGGVCCTRLPTLLPLLPWAVRGAKVWVDFAFIRHVPKSVFKKRRNSVSVVPVGGVCCTRLPTLLPLLPWAVTAADD